MKKIFRPFWSFDIEKTEKWLSAMSSKGLHVVEMNTMTRQFYFEEGSHMEINYRIMYEKPPIHTMPQALYNDGWQRVCHHRKWQLVRNECATENIQRFPVSEGIFKRNRIWMYIFGGLFIYMIGIAMFFAFVTIWMLLTGGNITIEESPMWIVTITWGIIIWTLVPYAAIKLYKSNKKLLRRTNRVKETSNFSSSYDFAKRKLGWIYSPDKLENWLGQMERRGYQLVRVNKLGSKFYFRKGAPRRVRYCADYQNTLTQDYFHMHEEAGWHLVYSQTSFLAKWSIWSKVFTSEEEVPQLYSDHENKLKHARRVAMTHSLMFGTLFIMYLYLIYLNIDLAKRDGMDLLTWMIFIIFGISIIEFGIIVMKSGLYYRRIKKYKRGRYSIEQCRRVEK